MTTTDHAATLAAALRKACDDLDQFSDDGARDYRAALAAYDAVAATAYPDIVEAFAGSTSQYDVGFRDAVESFMAAGVGPENVNDVLQAFGNNAPDDDDTNAPFSLDPPGYAARVRQLEAQGMTTSDAQSVADVEFMS